MFKLIISLLIFSFVYSKGIPNYLNICHFKDPNFEGCAVENANKAFPSIVKGDKRFSVPSLNPMHISRIYIDSSNNGITIDITNVTVYGLEGIIVKDFRVLPDKKKIELYYYMDRVEILGHYKAQGKILIIPLNGEGRSNITGVGCNFTYTYKYNLVPKGGELYALPNGSDFEMKLKRSYFDFQNLVGGSIVDQMKNFLNDNWEEVLNDLGTGFTQPISVIAESIFGAYFKKIPFKQLLPGIEI